jgi:hypothetical protein
MAAYMRHSVLIVLCLLSLVSAGSVSAACAADWGHGVESLTVAHSGSAGTADCDMGKNDQSRNKAPKCNHDACCGYQSVTIPEIGGFFTPDLPRAAAVASVTKHLAGSGWETLLDPPRA